MVIWEYSRKSSDQLCNLRKCPLSFSNFALYVMVCNEMNQLVTQVISTHRFIVISASSFWDWFGSCWDMLLLKKERSSMFTRVCWRCIGADGKTQARARSDTGSSKGTVPCAYQATGKSTLVWINTISCNQWTAAEKRLITIFLCCMFSYTSRFLFGQFLLFNPVSEFHLFQSIASCRWS